MPHTPSTRLRELLAKWVMLPPVSRESMLGVWRGEALSAGSIFTILLEESAWCGKVFRSFDDVDALVFGAPRSFVAIVNRLMIAPFRLPEDRRRVRHPLGAARLETRVLYGTASAAMRYRRLPIVDHFRRLDDRRVLGLMEVRGSGEPELFFGLERVDGALR